MAAGARMRASQSGKFLQLGVLIGAAALIGVLLVSRGGLHHDGSGVGLALVTAVERIAACAWPGAVYLLSSMGLGLGVLRVLGWWDHQRSVSVAMAAGLGLQLIITLAAGALGGLASGWWAWALVGPGLVLLGLKLSGLGARDAGAAARGHWLVEALRGRAGEVAAGTANFGVVIGFVVIGIMLATAASTPGVLWRSEFGGYDALSYHLQLPQEWLAGGKVQTVPHNVYSALPSGLEAAFAHVTRLGFADDMLARDGFGLFASQMLHGMLGIVAACGVAGLARRVAMAAGCAEPTGLIAAGFAGVLTLATPWVVVVSSLAYNEMGVVLGLAACGVVLVNAWARREEMSGGREGLGKAARLGAVLAIIVGGACASKPTAMLFVGLPSALVLLCVMLRGTAHLGAARWRWVAVLAGSGCVVGVAMILPWMLRNWNATGNPVFPFAAGLFANADGSMGWWSGEQVARFGASHRSEGSMLARLRLMVLPDASDPAVAGGVHRGLLHAQWGPWLVLGCVVGVVVMPVLALARRNARAGVWLVLAMVMVVQLVVWLGFTHIQSRFLVPMVVPMAVVLGVAAARLEAWRESRAGAKPSQLVGILVMIAAVALLIGKGRAMGLTNVGLLFGPADRAGTSAAARALPDADKTSEQLVNTLFGKGERVLLVGDATPLFYDASKVGYSTTWDTNPLAELLAGEGEDAKVVAGLRGRGFTHVLVNFAELDRLGRSKFLDPRLEIERIARLVRSQELVRAWDGTGQVLVRLR